MKPILILTIEHTKPLPVKSPITDVVSERTYNFLYAQGCEASVTASQLLEVPPRLQLWEQE